MVAYTTTKNLALVANSSYVGLWDVPTNSNWDIVDAAIGGSVAISLNNSNVVLSGAQFQQQQITFNSTLTGSVTITFPSTYTGSYSITNVCTGSSAFTVTLATTVSSGLHVCCPPGETVDVINSGVDLRYKNIGRVGSYMDYAGSSVPSWIDGCSIPPYLNCDGSVFSAATYPALAIILAGTTLPDSKGRFRLTLDQGATRVTSAVSGLAGDTIFSGGGSQLISDHSHPVTDPGHTHDVAGGDNADGGTAPFNVSVAADNYNGQTGTAAALSHVTNLTVANSTYGGSAQNIPPAYVGGLTLIRAA